MRISLTGRSANIFNVKIEFVFREIALGSTLTCIVLNFKTAELPMRITGPKNSYNFITRFYDLFTNKPISIYFKQALNNLLLKLRISNKLNYSSYNN